MCGRTARTDRWGQEGTGTSRPQPRGARRLSAARPISLKPNISNALTVARRQMRRDDGCVTVQEDGRRAPRDGQRGFSMHVSIQNLAIGKDAPLSAAILGADANAAGPKTSYRARQPRNTPSRSNISVAVYPGSVGEHDRVRERRRAVALARHFHETEGLSIAQIAERLGRSSATIKALLL